MLIKAHQCIFIHIPKTAGQSVEHYFLNLPNMKNFHREALLLGKNRNPERGPPQLSHLRACEYLSGGYLTEQQFDDYFKFSFVRNSWDRIVSFYKYRGHAYKYDFKTFLFRHLPAPGWSNDYAQIRPQHDYLYDRERCLVDFVGKFENLQQDCDTVCDKLGLPHAPLQHINKSLHRHSVLSLLMGERRKIVRNLKRILRRGSMKRNTFGHFSEFYDDESRDFVADLYRDDIVAFGYEFVHRKLSPR